MTSSSSEIISQEAESMSASDHIMNCSMYSRRLHQTGTPEGEFNNFECFQNYTASEVFVQGLAGIVNQSDVETMIRAQKHMWVHKQHAGPLRVVSNINQLIVGVSW